MQQNIEAQQQTQEALQAMKEGNLPKAESQLEAVCAQYPQDGQAWYYLAMVKGQKGDMPGVVQCSEKALLLDPQNGPAYENVGNALAALGMSDEALAAYDKALEYAPAHPRLLNNFGNVLFLIGQPDEAILKLQEAVRLQPDYIQAHQTLGNIYAQLRQVDEAVAHYLRVLESQPANLDITLKVGDLMTEMGLAREAEACYQRCLQHHPNEVALYMGLAAVLRDSGRYAEALVALQEAARIKPDDLFIAGCEVDILERQGELDEANVKLRGLLDKGYRHKNVANVFLRMCRRTGQCEEAIAVAHEALAKSSKDKRAAGQLHHALGKLHDKLGAYDEAFEHYKQCNELAGLTFDVAAHRQKVDGLIAAFRPEIMSQLPRADNRSQRPIFILGMPRSGTTLVEQIIASHPDVYGAGELRFISDLIHSLPPNLYPASLATITKDVVDGMAGQYLAAIGDLNSGASRVTDKMPQNFLELGMISLMLPKARVIHCLRDPLDTCLSIYFQNFNQSHDYATDLASIGYYYKEYQRLMAHWQAVVDIPIFEVRYADLIGDQERLSRAMIEFCGLDWDERCLRFHEHERGVATASYDQVRQPIYTSSLGRWKNYEKFLGPLKRSLGLD